jgi:DNA-directed RNA polymerase subunit RPC12/RpoP
MDTQPKTYQCGNCKGIFERTRTDAECLEEFERLMPECVNDEKAIVCDNCWTKIMAWIDTLTPQEKDELRDDYGREKH